MCTKIKAIYNSYIQETKGNDDEVSSAAEKAGFISGFRYAVNLMTECYAGDHKVTVEHG